MANYFQPIFQINYEPPLEPNTKVSLSMGPQHLAYAGFNIPVMVTDVPLEKGAMPSKGKLVMAHLDTGASRTTIDEKLAAELGLVPIGVSLIHTAAGPKDSKSYAISISFPDTGLRGYKLTVDDCVLPYDDTLPDLNPHNFALLIGRDVMANWNIVWNGPSSTVFLSD